MTRDLIRIIVADDHAVVRAGLRAIVSMANDMEVVGEASTGREAVAMAERLKPDVIVMDLDMPDLDGAAATKEIVSRGLATRVLVLTMHEAEDYLVPVMKAGASGYLLKSAADRELVAAIRRVAFGDVYMQPAAARVLARSFAKAIASP
jgi:DNA-binding NarL/FixJ family response regulator